MIHHDPYETDNADSPILWTQNGMDNLGIDAVNMNDAAKIASGKSGTEYGATVSVYNATNTFMGDVLKMKLGSLFNRVGSSGLEPADRTWDSIFQSGAMENGGLCLAKMQPAILFGGGMPTVIRIITINLMKKKVNQRLCVRDQLDE